MKEADMDLTGEGWLALARRIRKNGGPIEDAEYALIRAKALLGSGGIIDRELLVTLALMPGRETDVVALATTIYEADPAGATALLCAEALIDLGRHQEALDWAERALSADPASTWVMCVKASALRRLERPDDAESLLAQALRLAPHDNNARFQMFALKSHPSLGEPSPETLELGQHLMDLAPPEPALIAAVANAHYRAKDHEGAERLFEGAVERAVEDGVGIEAAKAWLEDFKGWTRPG